jgi:hypothetical protein
MKDELLVAFVACRKLDFAVNTLMSRGRRVSFPSLCCLFITPPTLPGQPIIFIGQEH